MRIVIILAVLTAVTGSPSVTIRPEADSTDVSAHPNSVPRTVKGSKIFGEVRGNTNPLIKCFRLCEKLMICTGKELHTKKYQII